MGALSTGMRGAGRLWVLLGARDAASEAAGLGGGIELGASCPERTPRRCRCHSQHPWSDRMTHMTFGSYCLGRGLAAWGTVALGGLMGDQRFQL